MFLRTVWNVTIDMNSRLFPVVKRSLSVSGRESVRDLASKDGELRVFLVAGEVSGDIIASRFMNSLKRLSPIPVRFAGVGGLMMSRQGLNSLFPMEDIAVMGIWELLPHLSMFKLRLKETIESALTFRPHVVLTVDSKGFSFRFLKKLRARYGEERLASPQHFHYVAPSFWAWRGGEARLKGLSEFVDHMFCILPFEAEVCRSNGLAATFVGHPTLEDALELKINKCIVNEWKVQGDGEKFRKNYGISSESTIISLLPGSRLQEVTRMLSIFSRTMELLKNAFSELTAVIHVAPNTHVEEYISKAVHEWPVSVVLVPGGSPCMRYNSFSMEKSSIARALGLVSTASLCLKLIPPTILVWT
ncbi:probable lipid-A-disaccharide synthase, mitochondrial isoform X2 [Sesamum indicum]|uniref:lipid-A-disaccharide synthase n=1 Tax=Sesamum indicum TaxID=4182 RepID=A0A6I9T0E9_SESIN|nr:probable lipid-A-disaccharide synthase, mitochondrial isoform X2 [Sesamum indicum]